MHTLVSLKRLKELNSLISTGTLVESKELPASYDGPEVTSIMYSHSSF